MNALRLRLLLPLVGFHLLAGCTSTLVKLDPENTVGGFTSPIAKSVGFHHANQFLQYQSSADAYGNKHEFIFPIGPASDALLEKTYAQVFQHVERVSSPTVPADSNKTFDAILQSKIKSFQFPLQSLKGPYWAEIVYGFTLSEVDGEVIHSWEIRGWGESGDGTQPGEFGPISESLEMAMQNAAKMFVQGFETIPEIKRWSIGDSLEGTTVAASEQRMRTNLKSGSGIQESFYDGIVAASAAMLPQSKGGAPSQAGITAIEVSVKNEGEGNIFLGPLNFVLVRPDGSQVNPIPGSFVAATLATRYARMGPVAPGVGLAAIPNLLVALANVQADTSEREEIQHQLNVWRKKELREKTIKPGDSAQGLVFFPVSAAKPIGVVKIPVVDMDTNRRYILGLNL